MLTAKPHLTHLTKSSDLVTTYEATRAGFVTAVLEKNRLATPFVTEAQTLRIKASAAKTPYALLEIKDIQAALLTAAGISNKATTHLKLEDTESMVREFIKNFLEPAGAKFVEELVYRFLLTRGETLGGKIKNVVGRWAQYRLTRIFISSLTLSGAPFYWWYTPTDKWLPNNDDIDAEKLRGLSWKANGKDRVMIYNLTSPLVKNDEEEKKRAGKNVDLCLFDASVTNFATQKLSKTIYNSPQSYIALGELKGGIDPAGADEHWKTGNSALRRIRESFAKLGATPHTFFVGNAIEQSMADEIWGQLNSGTLSNAANLNEDTQVVSLVTWLCGL